MDSKIDNIAIQLVERAVLYFTFLKYSKSAEVPVTGKSGDRFELISRDVYDSMFYFVKEMCSKNDAATAKSILSTADPECYSDTDRAIELFYGGPSRDRTEIMHYNSIITEVINRVLRSTEYLRVLDDNYQPHSYADARNYAAGRHHGRDVIYDTTDKRIVLFV